MDAANLGSRQVDLVDLLVREEAAYGSLVQKIELGALAANHLVAEPAQLARQGLADHSTVSRNKYPHMFFR
ncbi:hypothetical protein GmRootV15_31990 [Variovorax sp. V15]